MNNACSNTRVFLTNAESAIKLYIRKNEKIKVTVPLDKKQCAPIYKKNHGAVMLVYGRQFLFL